MDSATNRTAASPSAGRWRTWAGRVVAVVLGLLVGWLLIEIMLRFAARLDLLSVSLHEALTDVRMAPWGTDTIVPPPLVRTDSYFGSISRQADHYRWQVGGGAAVLDITTINWLDRNSHVGFRVDSPAWEPRWPVDAVVIGDSFTFCYTQYPDCWVTRLQSDYGLSVVNLGLPATGSVSHLRVLDTFGLAYKPRIVLWQWWGNDSFEDTLLKAISDPTGKHTLPAGVCDISSPVDTALRLYSAVASILHNLRCGYNPDTVDPYHVQSGQVTLSFGSEWFRIPFDMTSKENQRGWPMTQNALLQARKLAEAHGAEFIVILIPTKEEVYQNLTEPLLGSKGLAIYSQGREAVLAFCQANQMTCFDATPALTQHANQGEQVYWPADIHLNPEGNKVLAQAVDDFLRQRGLIQ